MAILSALMTMTKSPPSTFGVNVGLCLPRSRVAAATASRPSTTSVASMTYHERVVSPAFGVYVGTALPLVFGVSPVVGPGVTGCRSRRRRWGCDSRRPTLTRDPGSPARTRGVPHANEGSLPGVIRAGQNALILASGTRSQRSAVVEAQYPYQDAGLSVHQRVEDLLSRMPLADKVGLMFHTIAVPADVDAVVPLGTLAALAGGQGSAALQRPGLAAGRPVLRPVAQQRAIAALQHPLGIPVTFSSDPRHRFGDNPLTQMMAGPFSCGPSRSGWQRSARRTGCGSSPTSCARSTWRSASASHCTPTRCGDRTALVADQHHVRRGCRPHLPARCRLRRRPTGPPTRCRFGDRDGQAFPGGGPSLDGNDPHFGWGREQVYPGDNAAYHLAPFRAALDAGAAEVMPYYGMPVGTDWDEVGFGFNKSVITGLLRDELGFDGIVCTDWGLVSDHPDLGDLGVARAWGSSTWGPADRALRVIGRRRPVRRRGLHRKYCWDWCATAGSANRGSTSRCAGCCGSRSPWGCSTTRSSTRSPRRSRWAASTFETPDWPPSATR